MPKSPRQKHKLFALLRILARDSDESHPLTTSELIRRLADMDIGVERKTLYQDIETLIDLGYDIVQLPTRRGGGYYMAGREFELPELKLLADAISSSRFITTRKSRELISKLEKFVSRYDAGQLHRQVYVAGRVKTENESIYYSIDTIHRAIAENSQISFVYLDWSVEKRLVPRREERYILSPWGLIWRDENYYLAAYDQEAEKMKHFRVDKMGEVDILNIPRLGEAVFRHTDPAVYANRIFGMFGGEEALVVLRFPRRLLGVVMDRFGKDVDIRPQGDDFFRVRARVVVSGQFFGWMAGIGPSLHLVSPAQVRADYRRWLLDILEKDMNMKED